MVAANRASSVVHEVEDDEARRFIREWKATFDASPKGYKNSDYGTRGYPEPGWSELRAAADRAHDRLGLILRETRDGKK